MGLKIMQLYVYLNKIGLADQIHLRNQEIIFYHWNSIQSDLIKSLVIRNNLIEQITYPRSIVPLLYRAINTELENDLNIEKFKFIKDKRNDE